MFFQWKNLMIECLVKLSLSRYLFPINFLNSISLFFLIIILF